jgi:hypothetical protein
MPLFDVIACAQTWYAACIEAVDLAEAREKASNLTPVDSALREHPDEYTFEIWDVIRCDEDGEEREEE